ncbi:unnamed protein product [Rhizoctonia solani]|uniref:BZIP domain-containing protein n=1 Tax=Rhizoctonia solani TaxID=456999 RepID=A0A8H3GXK4_9AGAM|nr:unnamed protein product [Rhizoctonia solani]
MVSQLGLSKDAPSSPQPTKSRPLSRNAQAQARLRARRRAYVESLEVEIKRLQGIVDATALRPVRNPHASPHSSTPLGACSSPAPSFSSNSEPGSSSRPLNTVQQLRSDNDRLRRERDAFRVQVEALMGYVSRGCELPSILPNSSSVGGVLSDHKRQDAAASRQVEQGYSPTLDDEMDSEDRQVRLPDSCFKVNFADPAWLQSQDPFSQSPLIQPSAYTKDETNQLFSLYGSNIAFLRHLDLHAQGSAFYATGDKSIQLPVLPGSNLFGAL